VAAGSIEEAGPGDRAAIRDLFLAAFGPYRTTAEWDWRYSPDGSRWQSLVLRGDDGGVAGHIGWALFPSWIDGGPGVAATGGDTMVAEAARGQRAMQRLIEAKVALVRAKGADVRVTFPREGLGPRVASYGGGELVGDLPQWVRWCHGRALRASAGSHQPVVVPAVAAAYVATTRAVARLAAEAPATHTVAPLDLDDPGVAELVRRSAGYAAIVRVRDADYLRWRWAQPPGRWSAWGARDRSGRLTGLAVAGLESDDGHGTIGRIVDFLADDRATTTALLHGTAAALEAGGADLVTFDYNDPRPWSRRACYLAGFAPRGRGPSTVVVTLSARAEGLPTGWRGWYLTFGDTDLA
jgi:hypothetical protein